MSNHYFDHTNTKIMWLGFVLSNSTRAALVAIVSSDFIGTICHSAWVWILRKCEFTHLSVTA